MKHLFILLVSAMMVATSCSPTTPKSENAPAEEAANPVIETILSRRSIRTYKDQPVARELLQQIAECGISAPNGMNAQQWEVRIVDSKEWIDGATAVYKGSVKADSPMAKQFSDPSFKNMFRNAPAVIFIAHKPGPCTEVDCGLMAGNIVLSAKSLGLGSICMMGPLGFFSTPAGEPFLKSLNLSEGYELLLCIGIGYADEQPEARPRRKEVIQFVEK